MIRLSWLISMGITLIGFLIIGNLFTVKAENALGNFGFVGIIFVIPFLLLSLVTTFRYFLVLTRSLSNHLTKTLSVISEAVLITVLIYFVMDYKETISETILFPKLNETTYSIYFNIYTFALIHSISCFLGSLFSFFLAKPKLSSKE